MRTSRRKCCTRWRPSARCLSGRGGIPQPVKMFPLMMSAAVALALAATAFAADNRKEVRLDVAPGATVNIVNSAGSVTLHSDNGRQLQLVYTTHSDKVEVDQNSTADNKRIEIVTHALPEQKPSADEARVDYDITV